MTRPHRILPLAGAILAAAALAGPAQGASTSFTITGAGFGHGIGMSQYGAYGYALHGTGYASILSHYYQGTALGQAPAGSVVRVLLQTPRTATFTGANKVGGQAIDPAQTYKVSSSGPNVVVADAQDHKVGTFGAPLVVTGSGPIRLNGLAGNGVRSGLYRGWFEFRPAPFNGVLAINAIGLEQYVAGVVSAESPSSWPLAALEAQAVTARTYAVTTSVAPSSGYTQFADTRSQMYRGVAAETASTNQAVNGTRNQVVTYQGKPVATFFFSTSGGQTENIEDSFIGSTPRPWLRSVADPYDNTSPLHRWKPEKLTMAQAARHLGGLIKGKFVGIRVVQRGVSPRIMYANVVGTAGTTRVTGPQLRSRFGLDDTWAYFTSVSSKVQAPPAAPQPPAGNPAPADGGGAQASRANLLVGRISPAAPGTTLRVQRREGSRWVAAGSGVVGRSGSYRVPVGAAGTYRVVTARAIGPDVRVGL